MMNGKKSMESIANGLVTLQKSCSDKTGYATGNTHLGDIHGDIYKLAGALISSGAAIMGRPNVIRRDIVTGEIVTDDEFIRMKPKYKTAYIVKNTGRIIDMTKEGYEKLSYDEQQEVTYTPRYPQIPNLVKNPKYNGTFVQTGDIIDRGKYSTECYLLMHSLIENNNMTTEPKIVFVLGNHEIDCIEKESVPVRQLMTKDVKNNNAFFTYYDKKTNTIGSHSFIVKKHFDNAFETFKNNIDLIKNTPIYGEKGAFFPQNEEEMKKLTLMSEKLNNNKELTNTEDKEIFAKFMNSMGKIYFFHNKKIEGYRKINIGKMLKEKTDYFTNQFWDRDFKSIETDGIAGFNQVIGHTSIFEIERLDNSIMTNGDLVHLKNKENIIMAGDISKLGEGCIQCHQFNANGISGALNGTMQEINYITIKQQIQKKPIKVDDTNGTRKEAISNKEPAIVNAPPPAPKLESSWQFENEIKRIAASNEDNKYQKVVENIKNYMEIQDKNNPSDAKVYLCETLLNKSLSALKITNPEQKSAFIKQVFDSSMQNNEIAKKTIEQISKNDKSIQLSSL
ncbi:MAG: hypothetical protein Ta2D_09240 [Rickettsiales bacterium]|nr:MAG: hypothetical protein Ta2D_09240 [Rickettsiales bacterium]